MVGNQSRHQHEGLARLVGQMRSCDCAPANQNEASNFLAPGDGHPGDRRALTAERNEKSGVPCYPPFQHPGA